MVLPQVPGELHQTSKPVPGPPIHPPPSLTFPRRLLGPAPTGRQTGRTRPQDARGAEPRRLPFGLSSRLGCFKSTSTVRVAGPSGPPRSPPSFPPPPLPLAGPPKSVVPDPGFIASEALIHRSIKKSVPFFEEEEGERWKRKRSREERRTQRSAPRGKGTERASTARIATWTDSYAPPTTCSRFSPLQVSAPPGPDVRETVFAPRR